MDARQLIHFKQRLIEEKKNVLDTLQRMEDHQPNQASMREYTEELSAYDNHPADLGTEMFMTAMQANLENHHRYRITEIDRALEKIEEGTYGDCELCGNTIPEERLEMLPDANICMGCAEDKLPIDDLQHYRPVEEDLMSPSFRTSYRDYRNFTGFDEEDAYQAVARYNKIPSDPSFNGGDFMGVFDQDDFDSSHENVEDVSNEQYIDQLPYTGDGMLELADEIGYGIENPIDFEDTKDRDSRKKKKER